MIKLKDIIKESKVSYLTETFKSKLLRKLSSKQNWQLDRDLYSWLAKLGVKASEIEDHQINRNVKPLKKGIEIAVSGKKITLRAKGNRYWESDQEIDKGVVLNVFKDGKPVWYTKGWRAKDISVSSPSKWGAENMKTFGLQKYGYQSLSSILKIPGMTFYQILLDEDMPYMGAEKIRKLRMDIQDGYWRWRDDNDFKQENERRYTDAMKRLYSDPAKVKGLIKKAKDYANKLILGLVGGKPNAISDRVISQSKVDVTDEGEVMRVLSDITTAMKKLYEKVDYYSNDLERDIQNKEDNPDWTGTYDSAPKRGKDVAEMVGKITKGNFAGIW